MPNLQQTSFFSTMLDDFTKINAALLAGYLKHTDNESIKRSHFQQGRYENIYIGKDLIPEIETILNTAIGHTANILDLDKNVLKAGLWFNAMGPGHLTLTHKHDDYDELLSAVYYITVPEDSGELILHHKPFTSHVSPQAGMFVFFPPELNHEVSKNNSNEIRLSLGINIGPK